MIWSRDHKEKFKWHEWFAWYPVVIESSKTKGQIVWLQRIWRKSFTFDGLFSLHDHSLTRPESPSAGGQ